MGKSVLVKRFIDAIADDTTTVIVGTCEPDPVELFQPFPQLVRDALALAPATDTAPALLGELHQLAPDLSDRLPESGDARRSRRPVGSACSRRSRRCSRTRSVRA